MSKFCRIFTIFALLVFLVNLFGCAASTQTSLGPSVPLSNYNIVLAPPPLQGLVVSSIHLNGCCSPTVSVSQMENALRRELLSCGARFGPNGAVITGNVRIVIDHCCPCRGTLVVEVKTSGYARLFSSVDNIKLNCVDGVILINPQDYEWAAWLVMVDFTGQMM